MICPVFDGARQAPTQIAIESESSEITYEELNEQVERWVNANRDVSALEPIDVPACSKSIVQLFGQLRLGQVVVIQDPRLPEQSRREQLDAIREFLPKNSRRRIESTAPTLSLDQLSTLLFSSGSSGKSKAIVHRMENHVTSAKKTHPDLMLKGNDKYYLSLPIHHISGLAIVFRCIFAMATIKLSEKETWKHAIFDESVTRLSLVPNQLEHLLTTTKPWPALKSILLGGATLSPQRRERLIEQNWPVYFSYGLSETASHICVATIDAGNCGPPLEDRSIYIDSNQHIWAGGASLFEGYLDKGVTCRRTNVEGQFDTKDLGKWKQEGLLITGRSDTMFISGGLNIYPSEIENALMQIDGITAGRVIEDTDETFGHIPIAFVRRKTSIDGKTIKSRLSPLLSPFKIPKRIYELPIASVKPSKSELQEIARLGKEI